MNNLWRVKARVQRRVSVAGVSLSPESLTRERKKEKYWFCTPFVDLALTFLQVKFALLQIKFNSPRS